MRVTISLRSTRVISLSHSECVLYPAGDQVLPVPRHGETRMQNRPVYAHGCFPDFVHFKHFSLGDCTRSYVFCLILPSYVRDDHAIGRYATLNYYELVVYRRVLVSINYNYRPIPYSSFLSRETRFETCSLHARWKFFTAQVTSSEEPLHNWRSGVAFMQYESFRTAHLSNVFSPSFLRPASSWGRFLIACLAPEITAYFLPRITATSWKTQRRNRA